MTELTVTLLRFGLLAALWLFVISVVGVLRGDLYGTRMVTRRSSGTRPRPRSRTGRQGAGQPPPPGGAARTGPGSEGADSRGRWGRGRAARTAPAYLTVVEGPLTGTSLPLRAAGTLIGRNPECALVLTDDYASGRHLQISRHDEAWIAEDLGSTNGTWVGSGSNVRRLAGPTTVGVGSQLRIGKTVVELRK